MRIFIQWTQKLAREDIEFDHANWSSLPKRGLPVTGELGGADNLRGWINTLTVMGITYHSDHYCIRDNGDGGVLVIAWNDDPDDRGDGRTATETVYYRPASDPALGGRMNTKYSVKIYADPETLSKMTPISHRGDDHVIAMLNYSEFTEPKDDRNTRHGVWCSDSKFAEHEKIRTARGWRLWIE
jgi:hypothetical protein